MKPELFYDIPMNDLLDGTQVQFKSPSLKNYLSATNSGGSTILANRAEASAWETFKLWRIDENHFNFRVSNKMFMGLSHMGTNRIVAMRDARNETEIFQIVRKDGDPNRVRIKASNGKFLQAISAETVVTADYGGSLGWDDSNPSVFDMTIVHSLDGEYQITNAYGPDKAPQVMQNHWDTYITEEDFRFMKSSGLDAVRIPVGWWIAYGSTPPKPFVGGSFQALKNAFTWAKNTGMKVIIDLHAVEHSQNGDAHRGTRDGSQEPWGDEYIDKTVEVIDFLAERFANDPALAAIELLNKPRVSYVNLSSLIKYYNAGYEAVRKYNPNAFVILSNRLGISDQRELFQFAQSLNNVVIDVHYYSVFDHDTFSQKTAEENIQYIYE